MLRPRVLLITAGIGVALVGSTACGGGTEEATPTTTGEQRGESQDGTSDQASSGSPEETVVRWWHPEDCDDMVTVYTSAVWEVMSDPAALEEMGYEDGTSALAGMSQDEAIEVCQRDPGEFGMGTIDRQPAELSADDLRVTPEGDDRAVVAYRLCADEGDPSSCGTYTWELLREDGEWRMDTMGPSMSSG